MAEYVEEGAELGRKGRARNCHVAANGNLMALILADDAMRLKPIAITAPANIIQKDENNPVDSCQHGYYMDDNERRVEIRKDETETARNKMATTNQYSRLTWK